MLKWLQLHRRRILNGIQNVVPVILDHLVEKGRIDPLQSEVYQEIMSDATVPLHKTRKLIETREETIQLKQQELDQLQSELQETQSLWNRAMKGSAPATWC